MRSFFAWIYAAGFTLFIMLFLPLGAAANTLFPHFPAIEPNVAFWIKIYAEYSTTQAVVHDSRDLSIIYEVIDLKPHDSGAGRKVNQRLMKNIKAKYENILRRLASDPDSKDAECRRVAKLFSPQSTSKTFRAASLGVRCQIGQSDRFRAGLIRSGAYIDEIRAIFRSYDLPEVLAYLPHVESSFDIKAYSKFGAAGIWQFTRSTGKRFMKVDYVLDERRDPILATHAAANLLKENHEKLGSWPLAVTAYNHGAAGMARAKEKHGDYPGIFTSYQSRTFKFASRNFYSEFLAACEVAANYQSYFGDLQFEKPSRYQVVALEGFIGFGQLCDRFNIQPEQAQDLNPALRPPVIQGQKLVPKNYPFRLPEGMTVAALPGDLYRDNQKPSHFYTVQHGDTAGKIARLHNVKLQDLILSNNLNRRADIYPKQTLRIPLPGKVLSDRPKPAQKTPAPILIAQNNDEKPTEPVGALKKESYPKPVMAAIIPSPDLESILNKETEAPPSMEVVSADVRFEKITGPESRRQGTLQVEVEETLGHYADWAGVRTQQIRRLNALPFGQTLHLHQKIKIPLTNVSATAFEESRYEFHKRLQEDFFAVYRISDLQPYHAKTGDNLWNLSLEKFSIPMWLLKNCNPQIDFAELRSHQKLMVPVIEKNTGEAPDSSVEPDNEEIPQELE